MSNFPRFTSLERLQREQFWHKMASTETLFVSVCFVMYYYRYVLVNHPTKMNIYNDLKNKPTFIFGK
jgi:hypothetical protein